MKPFDGSLLVRGGTLVDGTGAPAVRADVRVRAGQIVEVADDLAPDGEAEIDAGGAFVTPGFVESHSHFDGSMWWDPSCDPMPGYGTTTAVIGDCGLTVAPLTAAERPGMIDLFCFIEDLPVPAFERSIPWSWETWPEYRAAALANPAAMNIGVFVGMMPDAVRRVVVMLAEMLVGVFAIFMAYYGARLVMATWYNTIGDFPALSVGVTYLPIPIGGAILLCFVLERIILGRPPEPEGEAAAVH